MGSLMETHLLCPSVSKLLEVVNEDEEEDCQCSVELIDLQKGAIGRQQDPQKLLAPGNKRLMQKSFHT
ncbi:hypothetical protein MAR_027453 [Mya arenaria]|uniref:Uncharacterized protein n=1 Tax=Mya arenaria TaxID=6604 RepID=A0ABY7ETJ2_MYAAR|nr:hypothetical protein MAR_027453 [Mya arenaria]